MIRAFRSLALATTVLAALPAAAQTTPGQQAAPPLTVSDAGYFEGPGVNVPQDPDIRPAGPPRTLVW